MGFLDGLYNSIVRLVCGTSVEQQQQQQQQQPVSRPPQHAPYPPQKPHKPQATHDQQVSHEQKPHKPSQIPQLNQAQQPDAHRPLKPPHHRSDLNQINQHDPAYMSLRARANEEGDKMAKCFEDSHEAYARKDGALAKELSNQGKEHKRKMEELNAQASAWIFKKNNEDSGPGEIDLHGLYVKEAIAHTDKAIEDAKRHGDSQINLIVGKGLHSTGGIAKLKPAIEELMDKHQLLAELDPDNAGVLIVHLNGQRTGRGATMDADEVSRRLEQSDQGCVIM